MPVQVMTYAALAAHLKISPEAARALAKRLRVPRSLSHDGKALVTVDLAEIQHKPRPPRHDQALTGPLKARIEALQVEVAALERMAAGHRADFERERDRGDRLMADLLKAAADAMAAKEARARLEGELEALRIDGGGRGVLEGDSQLVGGRGQASSEVRRVAAALVEEDRTACR
jgi:hypothetical protein